MSDSFFLLLTKLVSNETYSNLAVQCSLAAALEHGNVWERENSLVHVSNKNVIRSAEHVFIGLISFPNRLNFYLTKRKGCEN